MKGHIRARGPGAWELKYDIGPDPVTGKRPFASLPCAAANVRRNAG